MSKRFSPNRAYPPPLDWQAAASCAILLLRLSAAHEKTRTDGRMANANAEGIGL